MQRFLVTLKTHAEGAADVILVDLQEHSPLRAVRAGLRSARGMGPFAVMQAVPWPKRFSCVNDAARKMASGA